MMLTPCCPRAGPTGGEGFALPAGTWSFTWAATFFAMRLVMRPPHMHAGTRAGAGMHRRAAPVRRSDPFDLQEFEVHRGGTTKDAHHNLQTPLVGLNLVHHTGEVGERPVDDSDALPAAEKDPMFWALRTRFHLLQD